MTERQQAELANALRVLIDGQGALRQLVVQQQQQMDLQRRAQEQASSRAQMEATIIRE